MQITQAKKRPSLVFTIIIYLCLASLSLLDSSAQQQSRFLKWSYQDAGGLLESIAPKVPLFAIAGGATLFTGIRIDEPFQDDVKESYASNSVWGHYLDITNEIGGTKVRLPVAGIFIATLFTKNTKLQDAAFTSLQSWLYSGILSYGLKHSFGRFRPEDGFGAGKFEPFSANSSFPSGHTTAAFALITPWVLYYPHPITYGLFALSTGTAIARMAQDKHWPTDVIAGAALGFFTGRYLTRRHLKKVVNPGLDIFSSAMPNGFVISVKW